MKLITPPDNVRDASLLNAWRLLYWIGFAFVVMGGTDITLAWYPAPFGNPEWEFGAISATLNGLALPTLGFYLLLCSAVARREHVAARVVATVMVVIVAGLLSLALIYGNVAPLALNSVADNRDVAAGMKKAILKATMLMIVYIALFVAGGIQGWRSRE